MLSKLLAGALPPAMKNAVFVALTHAIDLGRVICVTDEAGDRIIEPYLIFESKSGDMLLHGWQRAGAFRHAPPPRFCNLYLEDIAVVEVLPDRFTPHPDYNPRSPNFHQVLYAFGTEELEDPALPPPSRLKPERRGPPGRRSSGNSSPRSRWR